MKQSRPIIIDASVGVAIARSETDGVAAAEAFRMWRRDRRTLMVPSLFWLELANALLRRRGWKGSEVLRAVHDLDEFELETIELDRPAVVAAIHLSEQHGLTSYDATYLALAESVEGDLLTFDAALRTAAGDRAISLGGHRLSEAPAAYEYEVTWPNYKEASAYLAKLRAEALAGRVEARR